MPQSTSRSFDRILSVLVALTALGGAGYFARAGLDIAMVATGPALVCGACAVGTRSQVEILGLRPGGAGAIILSWVLVFAALVITVLALW